MKKILIAGGAGFIGSNLANRLSKDDEVTVIDNFISGERDNVKPKIKIINGDIINKNVIDNLSERYDQIYHLASPASPPLYQKYPLLTILANTKGTMNLLEKTTRDKARILFTSTSEIYGEPLEHPQKEEYRGNVNTTGIRSCYDESKRMGETLMSEYNRQYGTDIRIARLFNTYGGNMQLDDGRVITNFIVDALFDQPIEISGKGTQTRSFCYVDDTIDALIRLMDYDGSYCSEPSFPEYQAPINIGNPNEMTILELAKIIIKLTNSKSEIRHKELPEDDPTRRCPDISKAKRILKWKPKVDLAEGLKKTIRYIKNEIKKE